MANTNPQSVARDRRKLRIRKVVHGGTGRPRMSVFRSANHIYAQVIDDVSGSTLCSASTLSPEVKAYAGHRGNIAAAKAVGKLIAERAAAANVTQVVFDRNGYLYHGRVKALADAAREAGLHF